MTRPLPIPPPYLATGISSKVAIRPLPTLAAKDDDSQMPLPRSPMINEFIVQPLDIHLIQKRKSQLPLKPCMEEQQLVAGNSTTVESGANISTHGTSSITFFPVLDDDIFQHGSKTSSIVDQFEMESESVEECSAAHMHQAVNDADMPHTPERLTVPAIQVEGPTPTTPPTLYSPSPSPTKVSTIRLVDSFLEVPQKVYSKLPSEHGNEQVLSIGSPSRHPDRQAGVDSTEELAEPPIKQAAIQLSDEKILEALSAFPTELEQPLSTIPGAVDIPEALEAPVMVNSELSSIRVVSSCSKMQVKYGINSLGKKWKGQPGFLGL